MTFKIGVVIVLTEIVALSVVGDVFINRYTDEMERNIATYVQIPGKLMQTGFLSFNSVEDRKTIEELVGEEIVEALIVSPDRNIYFSPDSADLGQPVSGIEGVDDTLFDKNDPRQETIFEGENVVSVTPLFGPDGGALRMFLYIKAGTGEMAVKKQAMIRLFVISSIVTVFLTSAIIILSFRISVQSRISELLEVLKRVESGDLTARSSGHIAGDELGTLQSGVNSMIAKLEKNVTNLEKLVSERTRKLERTNRDLETFAYSVSHDLRAPLRAIMGLTQIIETEYKDLLDEEGQNYFDRIVDASDHMGELIDGVLRLSRLGRKALEYQAVDLDLIIGRILEYLSGKVAETGAELSIAEDLPVVCGDPTLLDQIFTNLLSNALTYHKPDIPPQITVCGELKDGFAIVQVSDQGIGIPDEYAEQVFDVFRRLHSQAEYPGTGIGLSIVKKAVELMDGEVWVESPSGEGTTFFVKLPLAEADR